LSASHQTDKEAFAEGARRLWEDSQEAFRERDYEKAAQLVQAFVAEHGEGGGGLDPAQVRLQLGITLLRLKRTQEGVAELRRSVSLDPYLGRSRYKLGIGLARLGLEQEALDCLRQAVALDPDVADHQWRLAEELRRQGFMLDAYDAVYSCLELEPEHAEAQATLKALKKEGWHGWAFRKAKTFLSGRLWRGPVNAKSVKAKAAKAKPAKAKPAKAAKATPASTTEAEDRVSG